MDDLVGFAEFALALAGFASVALILVAIGFGASSVVQERALRKAGASPMPRGLMRVFWTATAVAHGIPLANLVGWPVGPSLGVMLLGLWVLLAMAAGQFTYLLFVTLR